MLRYILAGAAALAVVAAIALYFHSRSVAVGDMVMASRRNDVTAFAARIDWDNLREFLKNDLTEQRKAAAGSAFGDMGGPSLSDIPKVVDYYVRPENIDILYYLHGEVFPQVKEEDFIDSTGYAFPFGFQVTLGFPKTVAANDIPQVMRDRIKARFVFRLDGLTWKLREMHVPLFIVPRFVYDTPAVQVYGRPKP